MWKFEVRDIGDCHYRQLRTLVRLRLAEAHIVVRRSKVPWPQTVDTSDRQAQTIPIGETIN
jgi:hypothetical protein